MRKFDIKEEEASHESSNNSRGKKVHAFMSNRSFKEDDEDFSTRIRLRGE